MGKFTTAALIWAICLVTGFAQAPTTVLSGVYTKAQAERGDALYHARCANCHEGQEADGPELTGRVFLDRWREDTLDSLFTFIQTTMPGNTPGSLDDAATADVVAFILQWNELPPGDTELTADMVDQIQLVGPEGPQPLANLTIVRIVGCLTADPTDTWKLANASRPAPVRSRVVEGATPAELQAAAARPLGTQAFPLRSVSQQGASYAGHKVQVVGVLNRQRTIDGPVERINVMSLDSVASSCAS